MQKELQALILELAPQLKVEEVKNLHKTELEHLLRAAMNVWQPGPLSQGFLPLQDEVLQEQLRRKGVVELEETTPSPLDSRLRIWRGDITRLRSEAIVNAANNAMLGCFQPGHHCIDNAIHSAAGLQLRITCDRYMRDHEEGYVEPTGSAMITPAYNLPSDYVIHTVGPIVQGEQPTENQCLQLASSYANCLRLANEQGLHSIALCGISTGVFGFPKIQASEIAVAQARNFLKELGPGANFTIVFNVFSEEDDANYRSQLEL